MSKKVVPMKSSPKPIAGRKGIVAPKKKAITNSTTPHTFQNRERFYGSPNDQSDSDSDNDWDEEDDDWNNSGDSKTSSSQSSQPTNLTFEDIKNTANLPPGTDPSKREELLDETEFRFIFGMGKGKYKSLPDWKKQNLKKKVGLF